LIPKPNPINEQWQNLKRALFPKNHQVVLLPKLHQNNFSVLKPKKELSLPILNKEILVLQPNQ